MVSTIFDGIRINGSDDIRRVPSRLKRGLYPGELRHITILFVFPLLERWIKKDKKKLRQHADVPLVFFAKNSTRKR